MSDDEVLLGGVPAPLPLEAVSSWLSRLALSQGCSIRELLRFLNLRLDRDLDLQMHGPALTELRRKCRLRENAFGFAEFVVDGFHHAKLGAGWLLSDSQRNSRFRYCPCCLGRGGNSGGVMLILWRFVDWRYCPAHQCLMEERCFSCRTYVKFPVDMAETPAGREGFASQRRCQRCAVDLAAAPVVLIDFNSSEQFTDRERRWLRAGRKFVATLCGEGCVDQAHLRPSIERLAEAIPELGPQGAWPMIAARVRRQARMQ